MNAVQLLAGSLFLVVILALVALVAWPWARRKSPDLVLVANNLRWAALGRLGAFAAALALEPLGLAGQLAPQRLWVQVLAAVVLQDLAFWCIHRAAHRSALLWRFHAIHHEPERMGVSGALRGHPVEAALQAVCMGIPAGLVAGPQALAAAGLVLTLWTAWVHADVAWDTRRPIGALLNIACISPHLHGWHHAAAGPVSNYGFMLNVWDRLFGDYRNPDGDPTSYGIGSSAVLPSDSHRYGAGAKAPSRRGGAAAAAWAALRDTVKPREFVDGVDF